MARHRAENFVCECPIRFDFIISFTVNYDCIILFSNHRKTGDFLHNDHFKSRSKGLNFHLLKI